MREKASVLLLLTRHIIYARHPRRHVCSSDSRAASSLLGLAVASASSVSSAWLPPPVSRRWFQTRPARSPHAHERSARCNVDDQIQTAVLRDGVRERNRRALRPDAQASAARDDPSMMRYEPRHPARSTPAGAGRAARRALKRLRWRAMLRAGRRYAARRRASCEHIRDIRERRYACPPPRRHRRHYRADC